MAADAANRPANSVLPTSVLHCGSGPGRSTPGTAADTKAALEWEAESLVSLLAKLARVLIPETVPVGDPSTSPPPEDDA